VILEKSPDSSQDGAKDRWTVHITALYDKHAKRCKERDARPGLYGRVAQSGEKETRTSITGRKERRPHPRDGVERGGEERKNNTKGQISDWSANGSTTPFQSQTEPPSREPLTGRGEWEKNNRDIGVRRVHAEKVEAHRAPD